MTRKTPAEFERIPWFWILLAGFLAVLLLIATEQVRSLQNENLALKEQCGFEEIRITNQTQVRCGIYVGAVQYMENWFKIENCEVLGNG